MLPNVNHKDGDIYDANTLKTLHTVFFTLIIITGITGNSLVVIAVFFWREMKTPCNLLIANIAFADLGVSAISAPMRILELYKGWPFGAVFSCKVLAPLQDVFVCVSVITHTTVAVERYRAIVTPFQPRISRKTAKQAVAMCWVVCYVAVAIPQVIFLEYRQHETPFYHCYLELPSPHGHRTAYLMYLVVVFILAPLIVQGLSYSRVISKLRQNNQTQLSRHNVKLTETKRKKLKTRQKKHLIKMLCISTVIFQVCYLPRGIMMLIGEFASSEVRTRSLAFANAATLAIYYVKHVINPVILCILAKNFRKSFKAICSCFFTSR